MTKTNGTTDPREALRGCAIHIKQVGEAIVQAQEQRSQSVAVGDLDGVRKLTKRITDLKTDLDALAEGRELLKAKVADLDREQRLREVDEAIETIKPMIEEVCAAVEAFEQQILAAGKAYASARSRAAIAVRGPARECAALSRPIARSRARA